MASPDPIQRFLGVEGTSNPHTLLDLPLRNVQTHEIESALRERLARVFQHPEARSADADYVRRILRDAAEHLKREARSPHKANAAGNGDVPPWITQRKPSSEPPLFHLTAFDRLVLAVLVASGGWNAQSRARLVALAAAQGITVQGLMRVVQGLSQYARSGGARIAVSDITGGQSLSQFMPMAPAGPALGSALLDRMAENLSLELKRDSPWITIKLAVIFGALTLGALIFGVRVAFYAGEPRPSSTAQVATTPAPSRSSPSRAAPPTPAPPPLEAPSRRIATYPAIPTFLGNALPGESIRPSEQFAVAPARLDELARKLTVEDQPSEAVFRLWEAEIDAIAIGWQLADGSTRRHIESKLVEALRAASDRPSVSDRLLGSFAPPRTLAAPLDIWRGSWKVTTTWKVAAAADQLPPVITQRAGAMLNSMLPQSAAHRTAEDAARAWLDSLVPALVAMIELNEQSYDYWELWLTAQRGLGTGQRHDESIASALRAALSTETDLARPGRTVNIAARLLNIAIESGSPSIRAALASFFDDEQISTRDLWVLTSLLSMNDAATWFPDALVLPEDADMHHRWRIRDELERIWPAPAIAAEADSSADPAAGRALIVDEHLGQRWSAAADLMLSQMPLKDAQSPIDAMLRQVIQTAHLNDCAIALAVQHVDYAEAMLLAVETDPHGSRIHVSARRTPTPGQPMAPDGTWSTAYQEAGKAVEQRIEAIRTLRHTNAGDLGPADADVLVREAYRASPAEVRDAAQEIVLKFNRGFNVSQAMLDQFGEAPSTDSIAKLVGDFTSQPMPRARLAGYAAAARTALLQHMLELMPQDSGLDGLAAELGDVYAAQLSLLRGERTLQSAARAPQEVAATLVNHWHEQAGPLRVANPLPDTLPGLHRRRALRSRLIEGPMQEFAAHQLSILELIAYVTVAEQPARRDVVSAILGDAAVARNACETVIEQALHIERAIARVWRVRMGLAGTVIPPASNVMGPGFESGVASPAVVLLPPANMRDPSLAPWVPRLEALHPSNPQGYFELAEEIADAHAKPPARDLAKWLFAVSGVLDSGRLGRSACLALADMETDAQRKRRLIALAWLMGNSVLTLRAGAADAVAAPAQSQAAALMVSEGLGHYRRGQGHRAVDAFRKYGAEDLLKQFADRMGFAGGAERILDDCRHLRGSARPTLTTDQLARMLRVELALLSDDQRTWTSDLLLFGARPLIDVDPDRLAETLGVDATRIIFRNGKWGR